MTRTIARRTIASCEAPRRSADPTGWFLLQQRLVRDYETRQESSRTMIHWSIIGIMGRSLARTSTPSWQDPTRIST
jgi:hypothetical protein